MQVYKHYLGQENPNKQAMAMSEFRAVQQNEETAVHRLMEGVAHYVGSAVVGVVGVVAVVLLLVLVMKWRVLARSRCRASNCNAFIHCTAFLVSMLRARCLSALPPTPAPLPLQEHMRCDMIQQAIGDWYKYIVTVSFRIRVC